MAKLAEGRADQPPAAEAPAPGPGQLHRTINAIVYEGDTGAESREPATGRAGVADPSVY